MKCKEAYIALLSAPRADALPAELLQHLFRCAKCRQRQQRLLALEQEIRELPRPGESPDGRRELIARLEPRPILPLPTATPGARRWSDRVPLFVAAAAVLLALGLGVGWSLSHLADPPPGDGPVAASSRSPAAPAAPAAPAGGPREAVVSDILEKHIRLAESSSASEQLTLLADMAGELRGEALRMAKEGPVDDVPMVSNLYERLLCQGVVGRARTLPAEQRQGVVATLVQQLDQGAAEADHAAGTALPGARDGLRRLAAAARTAGRSLNGDAPAPAALPSAWVPVRSGTTRDLLGVLVLQAIQLAEENDPLRRAECCNDVAEHLVQGILLASSGGDTDRAARLGGFLNAVIDRGVASNLQRYQAAGPEDTRQAEVGRIGERSSRTVEVLEKNLEQAPAAAQPALEKALEATTGRPKHEPGKGKKGHRGLPPGLQRALEHGKAPPNMPKRSPKD